MKTATWATEYEKNQYITNEKKTTGHTAVAIILIYSTPEKIWEERYRNISRNTKRKLRWCQRNDITHNNDDY